MNRARSNSKSKIKFVYSDNDSLSVIFQDNDLLMGVVGEFNKNLKELEKLTIAENTLADDLAGLLEQISESGVSSGKAAAAQLEKAATDLKTANDKIEELNATITGYEIEQEQLENTITQFIPDEQIHALLVKKELLTHITEIYNTAEKHLMEKARSRIENKATKYMRNLLINRPESYDRLEIDEQFRINVIEPSGEVNKGINSAGASLIALSLVSGLRDEAMFQAPLIVDAGFGNIDDDNTALIIEHLNDNFPGQCVILAHDGEIREEQLNKLNTYTKWTIEASNQEQTSFLKESIPNL